jgi:hypothetical protein
MTEMILKKSKPPVTKRSFVSPWVELDYLCKKIHYWLYVRKNKARADRYQDRLEQVLKVLPNSDDNLAIIRQEGWALLHELKDEASQSILFRTREIELIERLHELARSPRHDEKARAYMLQGRDAVALQARRDILHSLKQEKLGRNRNGKAR